jgi:hypothetical protein
MHPSFPFCGTADQARSPGFSGEVRLPSEHRGPLDPHPESADLAWLPGYPLEDASQDDDAQGNYYQYQRCDTDLGGRAVSESSNSASCTVIPGQEQAALWQRQSRNGALLTKGI